MVFCPKMKIKFSQLPKRCDGKIAVWDNGEKHELWKEPEMYHSFIEYYKTNLHNCNIDYVTGEKIQCSEKHPSKIRNSGDKAKIFSANDWYPSPSK